jgi:hypothetical protein
MVKQLANELVSVESGRCIISVDSKCHSLWTSLLGNEPDLEHDSACTWYEIPRFIGIQDPPQSGFHLRAEDLLPY